MNLHQIQRSSDLDSISSPRVGSFLAGRTQDCESSSLFSRQISRHGRRSESALLSIRLLGRCRYRSQRDVTPGRENTRYSKQVELHFQDLASRLRLRNPGLHVSTRKTCSLREVLRARLAHIGLRTLCRHWHFSDAPRLVTHNYHLYCARFSGWRRNATNKNVRDT